MGLPPKSKVSFVIELNDKKDVEFLKTLVDPLTPTGLVILNTDDDLFNKYNNENLAEIHSLVKVCRFHFEERDDGRLNEHFNSLMQQAHLELAQTLIRTHLVPCVLVALKSQVVIHESGSLMDVIFTGAYIKQEKHQLLEIHERENNLMTASPLLNFP